MWEKGSKHWSFQGRRRRPRPAERGSRVTVSKARHLLRFATGATHGSKTQRRASRGPGGVAGRAASAESDRLRTACRLLSENVHRHVFSRVAKPTARAARRRKPPAIVHGSHGAVITTVYIAPPDRRMLLADVGRGVPGDWPDACRAQRALTRSGTSYLSHESPLVLLDDDRAEEETEGR